MKVLNILDKTCKLCIVIAFTSVIHTGKAGPTLWNSILRVEASPTNIRLKCGINQGREEFYSTGPRTVTLA
jgi:hypothetical protein